MGSRISFVERMSSGKLTRLAATQSVSSLCRHVQPLTVDMPISKAVETLRQSNLSSLPVVSGSRLVTMLPESALATRLMPYSEEDQQRIGSSPLSVILDSFLNSTMSIPILSRDETLENARIYFGLNPEESAVGVIDEFRTYQGVLSRYDLLAYKLKTLAPARVGGMATPLGVYLTDGVESGGVGNLGLFLAGATLTTLYAVAMVILNGLDIFSLAHHIDINGMIERPLTHLIPGYAVTIVTSIQTVLPLLTMLLLLRLIPVAGYHAAEHQVVHCIERGEPLIPKIVARMPRPHPRCGTNLVSAVLLFGACLSVFTVMLQSASAAIVPAGLLTLITWRQVGTFLQQYFTTKPASDKQIASGIKAGEDLLSKYRQDVNRRAKWPLRVWRMGFIQMIAGTMAPTSIVFLTAKFFPVVQPYLQGIY
jgi:CBS domain-containing protein